MRSTSPTAALVRAAGGIQAQSPIRAAAHCLAVVIVLAVILPAAFVADLVGAALREGGVTAAWARMRLWPRRSRDVLLIDVRMEPGSPPLNEFLVGECRVIPWPSMYGSVHRVMIHAIQYDSEDRKAHVSG